jgi:pimeloyl-ACP methyl ester carboxylesterase
MTAVRIPIRTLGLIGVALLVGCDDEIDQSATAPATAPSHAASLATPREDPVARVQTITGGGGLNLSVYDVGTSGARPIVFIHGFSQNYLTWDQQLLGLAESFHVVAYDMRGHGASDKPLEAERYTQSSLWADDLDAVIRARDLDRPVLVGWSYGGYVMADYIRKYGDGALGGLVFEGVSTKNGTAEAAGFLTDEVLSIFPDVLSADVRASIDGTRALASLFARHGSDPWEVAVASAMMVPPPIRVAMFSRVLDNDDVLASIRVPTLVVHGGADRIVRLSSAQHTASTVPGAKLLVYPGVGHAPHLETPGRFNRDLADFVRSIR